jgi:hypothetical protein
MHGIEKQKNKNSRDAASPVNIKLASKYLLQYFDFAKGVMTLIIKYTSIF